jgi:predicted methyltransferase
MIRRTTMAMAAGAMALAFAVTVQTQAQAQAPSAAIQAAVADPGRPEADRARDAARHPAEVVAFAGLKPGDKVADLIPGGGYFTRIFSKVVGPTGKVYAVVPDTPAPRPQGVQAMQELTAAYPSVTVINGPIAAFKPPEKLDVVWTSENYHDLRIPMFGSQNMAAFNKAVFDALKPGGVFYIEDHAAAAGSGDSATNTLHRIDPALVRREVEAAGFRFDGESKVLAHPEDPHSALVFDPSVRGKTDKFVMRFRKPR